MGKSMAFPVKTGLSLSPVKITGFNPVENRDGFLMEIGGETKCHWGWLIDDGFNLVGIFSRTIIDIMI